MTETNKKTTPAAEATPDYKKLYTAEYNKCKTLEAKIEEYDKICKALTEKANNAQENLQKATLEYNAKIKYALDCIRHAHVSIQLATNIE